MINYTNMLDKKIKKALIAEKERKMKSLIEEQLLKDRVMMVFESEDKIKNFNLLTEEERFDLSRRLFLELSELEQSGILTENLMDTFKSLFGNAFSGVVQSLIEPTVRKALNYIGITGYLQDFGVSLITRNPMEFIRGLSDCKIMTKLITKSLVEGLVMSLQKNITSQGFAWDAIRNALVDSLEESKFGESLTEALSTPVCEVYNNLMGNVKNVASKLTQNLPI